LSPKRITAMSRILIPIDFSECSLNALEYGLKYAEKTDPEPRIIIAHGYNIPIPAAEFSMSLNATVLDEFKKDAEAKFEKLKERFPALKKNSVKFDVKMAFVLDAILKCVHEENPHLIIMGTKGSSGINEVLFGSNTSGIIKSSKIPVIAVPENFKAGAISRITLAFDNKELEDSSILEIVRRLSSIYHAPVDILHIQNKSEENDDGPAMLANFFEGVQHEFHLIEGNDIAEEIEKFLDKSNSDLLAMIPKRHTIIERLFTRSITSKIAQHTRIPLLAIPIK